MHDATHTMEQPTFASDTAVRRIAEHRYEADLQAHWSSLLGIHGGYVTAVAASAIDAAIDDPTRPIRSLNAQFVRRPTAGSATVAVNVQHDGRTTSFVTARMTQADRLVLLVTAVCGQTRGGMKYSDTQAPRPPLPPAGSVQFAPTGVRTGHFINADIIMDPDVVPFGGGDKAWLGGWLRPLDGQPVTSTWLTCLADFFPPAVFSRTTGPVKAASIDFSVQFLSTTPHLHVAPGEYVYGQMYSAESSEGFAVEDGVIWAPDGTVLVTSRQLRLAGE